MPRRLAIFHPPGRLSLKHNPFGKDVANLQLFQALARHGGLERLDVLSVRPTTDELARTDLFEGVPQGATQVFAGSAMNPQLAVQAGAVLRGQPDLYELAWLRRRTAGDRAYSLLGLVHTLAPPFLRQSIAMASVGPIHAHDALICTSPAVREGLERMFADWGEHLAERTGGSPPATPMLPVIPLGVDGGAFAPNAAARARVRQELGLAEDQPVILWVGRLSYFEKAFPQPMFAAVDRAGRLTGTRPAFVMAGWFPNEADRELYESAARRHAPETALHVVDGNDRARLADLLAGADIFISLVDNIQETFGITPLEAMASGLPVVASDWDGYRYTMRDGIEAFLIPTLGGPQGGGVGHNMVTRHVLEVDTYQGYVGAVAQHTAVHIGRAAEALAALIGSPDLRRRMGEAGRARVREMLDWPVVARAYGELVDELARVRASATEPAARIRSNPVKGDPFRDFAHFATHALELDTRLHVPDGVTAADILATADVRLDAGFPHFRATREACAQAFELIASGQARTVREVLLATPVEGRRTLEMGLVWMAKYGFLDWLDQP